jgi:hypothetical protein
MNNTTLDLNEVTQMYRILGVGMGATKTEIRYMRNKLLGKFHPDRHVDWEANEDALNERVNYIQVAFLFIMEHYEEIQRTLAFLPEATLTNHIPTNIRSYWVYTTIEQIKQTDQEA